jgi:DNA-binding beta-propeller fold protein YncE
MRMNERKIAFWLTGAVVAALAATTILLLYFIRVPTNVAYVSEEDAGISVVDLKSLKVVRRVHPADVAPRGLGITYDGKYLVTSNKDTADIAVFSTPRLKLIKRMHLGDNPEFIKLDPSGNRLFATFEPGSESGPPGADDDDQDSNEAPAQIASFHIGDWAVGPVSTAGKETEGLEFSPGGKFLLVANEAQNNIGVFDKNTGAHIRDIDLKPYGRRPRGLKVSPQGTCYAVTMEASGTLLTLDENFNVLKFVQTAAKPYGVAFDRTGKRIFVSAAMARNLQVFSADSLQLLAEIPTGQRCWHFTFTPDDSKVLLACGKSNTVVVIDANAYIPLLIIEGFHTPWGIVTYPRAFGSLGLP